MNDPVLKINLLVRSELALARIQTRRAVSRIILSLIALVFVLLGLGMFNFSIYQAFIASFSPAVAGSFVALINLFLAGVIFMFAGKIGTESNEEKMAQEIRDLVYAELNSDVTSVKSEMSKVSDDIKKIRRGFNSFTETTGSIIPLFSLLTKAVSKKSNVSQRLNKSQG
ncbi:MAG: hypothetical protein ACI8PB_004892 [Desulforhopalus sp.]|jgi:hypothetical protein